MKKTKVLLTAVFSQKSTLVKGIVQAVSLLIILGIFGCAVTKVVDKVPQGDPKGFVEFYVMDEEINKYRQGFPEIYCNEVSQGSWPIFNPAWSRKDRRIIMISRKPGIHPFSIRWKMERKDIQVRIEEGKITPVKIGMTSSEKDTSINPNVSLVTTSLRMYVTTEEPVPSMK